MRSLSWTRKKGMLTQYRVSPLQSNPSIHIGEMTLTLVRCPRQRTHGTTYSPSSARQNQGDQTYYKLPYVLRRFGQINAAIGAGFLPQHVPDAYTRQSPWDTPLGRNRHRTYETVATIPQAGNSHIAKQARASCCSRRIGHCLNLLAHSLP